jgi:DedD protein
MGLLSFLKRNDAVKPAAKAPSADEVQRARTRARRRLIGAVVLLGVGIIGFPLVFETQPRPISVDLPIEIPRKDAAPPLTVPKASPQVRASGQVVTETAADAGKDVTEAQAPTTATPEASPAEPAKPPAPAAKPAEPSPKPVTAEAAKGADAAKPAEPREPAKVAAADAARAKALLEGQADEPGRFVVQVGAYADEAIAREARQKVEKLGLKTYTQVVDTSAGKRIRVRVGPFGSRDEADKVAGRIKSSGLGSQVLTL